MPEVGPPLTLDVGPALASLDKLMQGSEAVTASIKQGQATLNQSAAEAARQATAYSDALARQQAEVRSAAAATQSARDAVRELTQQQNEYVAAQRKLREGTEEYQRIQRLLDQNKQKIAEAKQAILENTAATRQEREAVQAIQEARRQEVNQTKQVTAAAKDAAAATKQEAAAAKEAGQEGDKSGGIFGGLQGKIAAAFSIAAVKQFIGNVIEAGQAAEATLSKLTFANGGNAQAAARDLAFIRTEADRLGLEINSAGQSYGSFTAAAAAANFPLADARKLFLATAGASATLKLSQGDTNGVLLALTQILSKGTVAAEELRGQIGERLPGAFSIAARSIGVTEAQLNKLLATGQVKSADFLPKFAEELQKTFGDGSAQAADSFSGNIARIDNEFTAFFLRFQSTASKGVGIVSGIFKRLNTALDLRSPEGRQRLGEGLAQQDIQSYEAVIKTITAQAEAQAKVSGDNANQAVTVALARQRGQLKADLAAAQDEAKRIEGLSVYNQLHFPGGRDALRDASVQAQRRVALLDGEIAKLDEVTAARKKADDPKDLEGLIKKQQDLIKALKVRQLAATQENQGGGKDFLLGKGGLDEEIKAAEKELDRLLGKVDKTAKAAADKLAAALRALEQERATLQSLAAKTAIKDSDDQAARAKLAFEEELRQAEVIKQKLIEREAAVRKAGGRGRNADGVIDGAQQQQITLLNQAAQDKYTKELARIQRERETLLLSLQKESDQRELDQLEAAFNEQVRLHEREAGVLLALEAKYERDRQALLEAQATRRAQSQQRISSSQASATSEVFGAGTGQSYFDAQLTARQQQLDADRTFAERRLEIIKDTNTAAANEERAALAAQLLRIRNQQRELTQDVSKSKFSVYKLLLGENDSPELRQQLDQTVQQSISAINQVLAAQAQAEQQKIQLHQENITGLQGQLAAEIALSREGSASNIKGIQDSISAEKAAKREALQESRRIAKEQELVNDLQAASSLALAVANIIAGWSTVPFLGSVFGLIAAGATVAGYIASKSAASDAAKGGGFFTGGFTGGSESNLHEERGPVHAREFVFDNEKTSKYRLSLFEPLHTGKPIDWAAPEVAALLPDLTLPEKMREEKAAHVRHSLEITHAPLQAELAQVRAELTEIKSSNAQMASRPDIAPFGNGYVVRWPNGSTDYIKSA